MKRALFFSESTTNYIKSFTLENCLELLSKAWENLHPNTLHKVWRSILSDALIIDKTESDSSTIVVEESSNFIQELDDAVVNLCPYSNNLVEESRKLLLDWLNRVKDDDCEWEALSDDKIIHFVTFGMVETNIVNIEEEAVDDYENLAEEVTSSEAMRSLIKLKSYMNTRNYSGEHYTSPKRIKHLLEEDMWASSSNNYSKI